MWNNVIALPKTLLQCSKRIIDSKRTAYILKRTKPLRLSKLGAQVPRKLKRPHYYYELIENTDVTKKPELDLVLVKDVPGIGMIGERVKANCFIGYRDLLLPKLAVYANSCEAVNIVRSEDEVQCSSKYSKIVANYLRGQTVSILLNQDVKWTLQSWHVKLALRKIGIITHEKCITLPSKEISGPNADVENKDFIVKVTMNKTETHSIRCRIYQLGNFGTHFKIQNNDLLDLPSEPLFPEEKENIDSLIAFQNNLKDSNVMKPQNYKSGKSKRRKF